MGLSERGDSFFYQRFVEVYWRLPSSVVIMSLPEELYNTVFFPICLPFSRSFGAVTIVASAASIQQQLHLSPSGSTKSTSLFPFPLLLKAFPSPPLPN